MPRSLNHESEQELRVYVPTSMSYIWREQQGKSEKTEQKRVVSKSGNDLLEIVLLQKCCDKCLIFLHGLNVKNSKKTILKVYFIQTKDIDYSSFLLTRTECFPYSLYRKEKKRSVQTLWNFVSNW